MTPKQMHRLVLLVLIVAVLDVIGNGVIVFRQQMIMNRQAVNNYEIEQLKASEKPHP